jgi:hypothetical protein
MDKKLLILFVAFSGIMASAETIKDIRIVDQSGESYDMASVAAFTSFKVGEQVSDQDHIVSSIGVPVSKA